MRKLKFRVWDTSYKKFITSEYIELNWDGDVVSIYDRGRDVEDAYPNKDAVLMQFTGLHDRNGKDVYDGDLCLDENVSSLIQIVWSDRYQWGCKIVKGGPLTKGLTFPLFHWEAYEANGFKSLEVIGNIYENPEHLEATP